MAEIKISLEAQQKEFVAALAEASKLVKVLTADIKELEKANKQHIAATKEAAHATKQSSQAHAAHAAEVKKNTFNIREQIGQLGKLVLTYFALYQVVRKVFEGISGTISAAVGNIDDFNKAAIGTAAAITNIADMSQEAGRTWNDVFLQNLRATKATFIELERLAAKYFASSTDLQLAYNAFAQRGVVIRSTELEQLAQLTDLILLLTQGQQSTIQIQEEIRSLINGTLRPTAQLGQLIKSFGLDLKDVSEQIRITQSLKPLEGLLVGARAATSEIQKTYQASLNGLETVLRQTGRVAGEGFFNNLVRSIQSFTDFLQRNQSKIGSVAAVLGEVLSDVLKRAQNFVELFLNGNNISKSIGPLIQLVAAVETLGSALFRVVEIAALMLRNLPLAISEFKKQLDLLDMPKEERALRGVIEEAQQAQKAMREVIADDTLPEGNRLAAAQFLKEFKNVEEQATTGLKKFQNAGGALGNFFDGLRKGAQSFLADLLPGVGEAKGLFSALGAAVQALSTDLDKLPKFSFGEEFDKNVKNLGKAVNDFQKRFQKTKEVSTETTFPTRIPFHRNAEDQAHFDRLTKQIGEAETRLARAQRQANELPIAQGIDTQLQALRRKLAFLEQGFKLTNGGFVEDLKTQAGETFQFIQNNLKELAQGGELKRLGTGISDALEQQVTRVFYNLRLQNDAAVEGLKEFKKQAQADEAELIRTDAQPHFDAEDKITKDANRIFDQTIENLIANIEDAENRLTQALFVKAPKAEINLLTKQVEEARNLFATGRITAEEVRQAQLAVAAAESKLGFDKQATIEAQTRLRIATEENKIEQEKLRVKQNLVQLGASILQQNQVILGQITALQQQAAAGQPRTDLEAQLGGINQSRLNVESNLDAVTGQLYALDVVVAQLAADGDPMAAELQEFTDAQRNLVEQRRTENEEIAKLLESQARMAIMWDAIGNAADKLTGGLSDALLKSFEGVKTDFKRFGKDITDSLFKDSMKNVFQTFKKELQDGLGKAMVGLGKSLGLDEKMAESMGPMFVAGFALIASFVLGQLMGDQGGSGTAANPTVGIESTEQVRGLIGGETAIPIGQIAESLQDALTPTNMWLSRIYGQLASMGNGGLSASQVESIIERSVNDALQMQA